MATTDQAINDGIIQEILKREGGYVNNPTDRGGRTDKGISERAHPAAWKDGKVTLEEATAIYRSKYLEGPGFDKVADPRLRSQLVDWGVNSGPGVAVQAIQRLVGAEVDGILGPKTLHLINSHPEPLRLNNRLALERVKMVGRIVARDPKQSRFLNGWLNRITEFLHL